MAVSDLRYADKTREKARKKRLEKARLEGLEEKKNADVEAKRALVRVFFLNPKPQSPIPKPQSLNPKP